MRNDNVKNISGNAGTRAFVSGDFSQQGLKENLDGLSLKDIQGIAGWVDFYHQQYAYIGSVIRKRYITTGMIVQMKRMWHKIKNTKRQEFITVYFLCLIYTLSFRYQLFKFIRLEWVIKYVNWINLMHVLRQGEIVVKVMKNAKVTLTVQTK